MSRASAKSIPGSARVGQYAVSKSKAGDEMKRAGLLPHDSGGAFLMNITPSYELLPIESRLQPLGEGAYGSVWLCQERDASAGSQPQSASAEVGSEELQQTRLNRPKQKLVIKCVAYLANSEECRRMLREVCLMSTMHHPHVSSALDAWTWQPPSVRQTLASVYFCNSLVRYSRCSCAS